MFPFRTLTRHWSVLLASLLLLTGGFTPAAFADHPPAPRLLPRSTLALISIADAPNLAERFMNTSTGRMSRDPQLKPLIDQLYGSLIEATTELKDRVGLSLPELLAIPQGEISVALVAPEDAEPALVILLDTGDQFSNAQKLIERFTAEVDRRGNPKREETIKGTKLIVYDRVGPQRRKAAYFVKDNTVVVASDPNVLKQLLAVWNGEKAETLSENPHFVDVMRRCRGSKGEPSQVIWYADPIGIVHAVGQQNAGARVALAVLPVLGVDGLSAVGGSMVFDAAQFDSVMQAHVSLDSPRTGVLKMIAFESGDVTPEPWVPSDVAAYMTLHWNVERTFTTFSSFYDSFRGEGALGRALEQRILGPTGIDFEKEIIRSLEGRITLITWIERPITLQSSRTLVGFKLKEPAVVKKALEKIFELERTPLARETHAGKQYYQVRIPRVQELPPEQRPPLPCFGVLNDYLLVSNGPGLYQEAVTTAAGSKSLADELDFKLIASKIRRQCGDRNPAMISFERPEESFRFLYELATDQRNRERLQTQAENNRFFKSLDTALKDNPLPPFEVLRRYMAPSGSMVIDDELGIHYTAFGMRRK